MMAWDAVLIQMTQAMVALQLVPSGSTEDEIRHLLNTCIGLAYTAKVKAEAEIPPESLRPKSY